MTRVKMNAKHEYEFIANFKVLQNTFRAHKVEKVHPSLSTQMFTLSHAAAYPRGKARQVQDAVRATPSPVRTTPAHAPLPCAVQG